DHIGLLRLRYGFRRVAPPGDGVARGGRRPARPSKGRAPGPPLWPNRPRDVRPVSLPRPDRPLRCRRLQDLISPCDHPEGPLVTAEVRMMLLRLRAERLMDLLHRGVRPHPQDRARIQRERMKAHKSTRFLPGHARRTALIPEPAGAHG